MKQQGHRGCKFSSSNPFEYGSNYTLNGGTNFLKTLLKRKHYFRLLDKKDSKEDQEFNSHNEITQHIEDIKELGTSIQTKPHNKKYLRAE